MKHTHWKRLLCLAMVMTMLLSFSAVFAAPYDKSNAANTYDQTNSKYTPVIDTSVHFDTYACLGDSISAGFGDYDYYTADGSHVEDINTADYSGITRDSLKWGTYDNYTYYYDDNIAQDAVVGVKKTGEYYDADGKPASGVTKYATRSSGEDGSVVYLDSSGEAVTVEEGYIPYTRSVSKDIEGNDFTYMGMRAVDKAYHSIVAKSVGAKTLYPMGFSGTRTTEVRGVLDPSYKGDDYLFLYGLINNYTERADGTIDYYTASEEADWNHRSFDFIREKYLTAIRNSDLITVNLGSNDIMTIPVINAMAKLYATDDAQFVALTKQMLGESYPEMLDTLFSTANTLNNVQQTLTTLLSLMTSGYRLYFENIMPVIDMIKAENPDAVVEVIGLYNPMQKIRFTDDSLIAIGKLGTSLIGGINGYLKANAARHGYIYVDVTGTETQDTPSLSVGLTAFFGRIMTDVHPNYAGHEYMAGQMIRALEAAGAGKQSSSPTPENVFPFTDVSPANWYYPEIYYAWSHGLMSGMSDTIFAPNAETTRAQFVQVLYRMAGTPSVAGMNNPFTDLSADWYRDAVIWAYHKGIAGGTTATTFSPDQAITRQQMVAMIYHFKGDPKTQGDLSVFKDGSSISAYARNAVMWAVENHVVSGFEDGTFRPAGVATRAQLATILHKLDLMK